MLTPRSRAREVALQLLFQKDQNPTPVPRDAIEAFVKDRLHGEAELIAYCLVLFDGVTANQSEIDPRIAAMAENWRLARMMPVDRSVLRLGAFELLFATDPPPRAVVLDECIELARRFGSKESAAFVNGVLDKLAPVTGGES
jgi:N utilization substance protein B